MNIRVAAIAALAVGALSIIVGILAMTLVPLTVSKQIIKVRGLDRIES